MTALLCFTVAVFGFVYVVGHSHASLPLRLALDPGELPKPATNSWLLRRWALVLIECPACLGFWVGLGAFLAGLAPRCFSGGLVCGLYCCGAGFILGRLTGITQP